MKTKLLPEQALLNACLTYDPETGLLTWKIREEWTFPVQEKRTPSHIANAWNAAWAGKPAFNSPTKNGYLQGSFNSIHYYAHRIIWMLVYGENPDDIDHDDGVRTNNRLANLFDRSRMANLKNRRLSSNNTSGYHGVSWSNRHKLWIATIYNEGVAVHLGWHKTIESAVSARKEAELFYGYHKNHGRAVNQADKPVDARESV